MIAGCKKNTGTPYNITSKRKKTKKMSDRMPKKACIFME
jgi:hypothetical protein